MLVAYRDGGASTLFSLINLWTLSGEPLKSFPPKGFVGLGSGSLAVTDPHGFNLVSIRLIRRASTPNAPPWRLICGWETSLPQPQPSSGLSLVAFGNR